MCPDSVGSERDREARAELDALKARIEEMAQAFEGHEAWAGQNAVTYRENGIPDAAEKMRVFAKDARINALRLRSLLSPEGKDEK